MSHNATEEKLAQWLGATAVATINGTMFAQFPTKPGKSRIERIRTAEDLAKGLVEAGGKQ